MLTIEASTMTSLMKQIETRALRNNPARLFSNFRRCYLRLRYAGIPFVRPRERERKSKKKKKEKYFKKTGKRRRRIVDSVRRRVSSTRFSISQSTDACNRSTSSRAKVTLLNNSPANLSHPLRFIRQV